MLIHHIICIQISSITFIESITIKQRTWVRVTAQWLKQLLDKAEDQKSNFGKTYKCQVDYTWVKTYLYCSNSLYLMQFYMHTFPISSNKYLELHLVNGKNYFLFQWEGILMIFFCLFLYVIIRPSNMHLANIFIYLFDRNYYLNI